MRRLKLVWAVVAVMTMLLVASAAPAMADIFDDDDDFDDFEDFADEACIGVLTVNKGGLDCLGVGEFGGGFDNFFEFADVDNFGDDDHHFDGHGNFFRHFD